MPNGTQEFEYILGKEFFINMESPDVQKGNVKVSLTVKHSNDIYDLSFTIKGMVFIPCDRCLDEMEHEIDTTYHLCVKYGEGYSDENDEVLIIPESDAYLNVAYMIYDSVVLTVPLKHVHPMGKCNKGMSIHLKKHTSRSMNAGDDEEVNEFDDSFEVDDMNEGDNEASDPRWDALKDLKEDNN